MEAIIKSSFDLSFERGSSEWSVAKAVRGDLRPMSRLFKNAIARQKLADYFFAPHSWTTDDEEARRLPATQEEMHASILASYADGIG